MVGGLWRWSVTSSGSGTTSGSGTSKAGSSVAQTPNPAGWGSCSSVRAGSWGLWRLLREGVAAGQGRGQGFAGAAAQAALVVRGRRWSGAAAGGGSMGFRSDALLHRRRDRAEEGPRLLERRRVAWSPGLRYRRGLGGRCDQSERCAERQERGDDRVPQLHYLVAGHDPSLSVQGDLRTLPMMCMRPAKCGTDARGALIFRWTPLGWGQLLRKIWRVLAVTLCGGWSLSGDELTEGPGEVWITGRRAGVGVPV